MKLPVLQMKKITIVIVFTLLACYTFASTTKTESENKEISASDDAIETSMVRLQNKVIAGIEVSVNPGFTANDVILTRTLTNIRIGYRLKQNVITGSLGVEFTEAMFMPITVDYKYYFNYTKVWSHYVYGQAGYSWHLKGNINSRYSSSKYVQIEPGALASVGFGYSYTTALNEFYFALGYSFRDYVEVRVVSSSGRKEYTDLSANGLSFTVGFNF